MNEANRHFTTKRCFCATVTAEAAVHPVAGVRWPAVDAIGSVAAETSLTRQLSNNTMHDIFGILARDPGG